MAENFTNSLIIKGEAKELNHFKMMATYNLDGIPIFSLDRYMPIPDNLKIAFEEGRPDSISVLRNWVLTSWGTIGVSEGEFKFISDNCLEICFDSIAGPIIPWLKSIALIYSGLNFSYTYNCVDNGLNETIQIIGEDYEEVTNRIPYKKASPILITLIYWDLKIKYFITDLFGTEDSTIRTSGWLMYIIFLHYKLRFYLAHRKAN